MKVPIRNGRDFFCPRSFGEPVGLECYSAILITFFKKTKFSFTKKTSYWAKLNLFYNFIVFIFVLLNH